MNKIIGKSSTSAKVVFSVQTSLTHTPEDAAPIVQLQRSFNSHGSELAPQLLVPKVVILVQT